MIDWLLMPIDPTRAHDIGAAVAWHGRLMVAGWGVLAPLGVLVARYFKVTPGQDWPRELDNKVWWHGHLSCQYAAGLCMIAGFAIIWSSSLRTETSWTHRSLGFVVLAFGALQFIAGWLRGSKGGPGEANPRGDHYDMTPRRVLFEHLHRTAGHVALALAAATILTGLWTANAPRWMWIAIVSWWLLLAAAALSLQWHGRRKSSYHAIWGPDPAHPGNRR